MAAILGLLNKLPVQLGVSTLIVFGVQTLVKVTPGTWYKSIKRPNWTPPNWAFPAVWIPLKLMQSVALALVMRGASQGAPVASTALAVGVFGVHLALGNMWNVVFFGQHKLKQSLPVMGAFWLSVAGSAAAFHPVSRTAAALMLPTLAWVTVAAKLNVDIVNLNTVPN